MKVLMTGGGGMLGKAVYPAFVEAGHDVDATDLKPRPAPGLPMAMLDVRDAAAIERRVRDAGPDLILHLAAETDLELCERDRDHAFVTNAIGTANVAQVAGNLDVPLVYISTAGVFDGTKTGPYDEFDVPNPINVYGASKYQGELLVREFTRRHYIVRAGWMIGGGDRDHKFVAKILDQLMQGSKTIHAVDDKLGTPTYTVDFARNLLALIDTDHFGLYHMACGGSGSRLEVAQVIIDHLDVRGIELVGVPSSFFATEYFAPRPMSEIMRNYVLDLRGMNLMRPWADALRAYLDERQR
jgi:dTDP-4-dehydrorhamnose reductase